MSRSFSSWKNCRLSGGVRHIDEDAREVVAEWFTLVAPTTVNDLSFGGNGAELLFEFDQRASDAAIGNRLAVIEP